MPLQIRRGTSAEKNVLASPPVAGELIWITDEARLYIGDGTTLASDLTPVTGYGDDNAKDAAASIFTTGTHSGISFSYDGSTSINATVNYPALLQNLNTNGFNITGNGNITITGSVTATSFVGDYKGSISADDSTILVDALNGSINLSGTVKGNIIPDQTELHDIGSTANKFNRIFLSATGLNVGSANISSTGSVINLPAGSTVGGVDIGTATGQGVVEGSNYNINIVSDNSSIMVDAFLQTMTADNGFFGDLTGNVIGGIVSGVIIGTSGSTLEGELVGSVFSDNSTLLIDGINGDAYLEDVTAQSLTSTSIETTSIETAKIDIASGGNSILADSIGMVIDINTLSGLYGFPGIAINSSLGPEAGGDVFRILTSHDEADASDVLFRRTKGTPASPTALSAGDNIFNIRYIARAVDEDSQAAVITVSADSNGTVGSNVVPGKIEFKTNNDNGELATKFSIDKDGIIDFFDNTTTAGSNSGEVDLATSTVAESWLRVKVGGVEYALPLYAINP